jgi:hypothetical protein
MLWELGDSRQGSGKERSTIRDSHRVDRVTRVHAILDCTTNVCFSNDVIL